MAIDRLRNAWATYANLRTYQDETRVSVETGAGLRRSSLDVPFEFIWRRPDQCAWRFLGHTLICDGRTLWQYQTGVSPGWRQARSSGELGMGQILMADPVTRLAGHTLVFRQLVARGSAELTSDLREVRWLGEDRTEAGDVDVIGSEDAGGTQITYWIGRKDSLIHKIVTDYTQAQGGGPVDATWPDGASRLIERHKYIRINRSVRARAFRPDVPTAPYPPPKERRDYRGWPVGF